MVHRLLDAWFRRVDLQVFPEEFILVDNLLRVDGVCEPSGERRISLAGLNIFPQINAPMGATYETFRVPINDSLMQRTGIESWLVKTSFPVRVTGSAL